MAVEPDDERHHEWGWYDLIGIAGAMVMTPVMILFYLVGPLALGLIALENGVPAFGWLLIAIWIPWIVLVFWDGLVLGMAAAVVWNLVTGPPRVIRAVIRRLRGRG